MHDQHFPESSESADRRSDRAVAALEYEERAGLGFRRRRAAGVGDPYADPERYQIGREASRGELFAGYLAGAGAVLGAASIAIRPLLLATIAVMLLLGGVMAGGPPARIGRIGLIISSVCFLVGMGIALGFDRPIV